jgi:hypothetical protein
MRRSSLSLPGGERRLPAPTRDEHCPPAFDHGECRPPVPGCDGLRRRTLTRIDRCPPTTTPAPSAYSSSSRARRWRRSSGHRTLAAGACPPSSNPPDASPSSLASAPILYTADAGARPLASQARSLPVLIFLVNTKLYEI